MTAERYVVIYRTGGWAECDWIRTSEAHLTWERAMEEVASLTKMGYKAFARELSMHQSIGFPVGWNWKLVDWQADKIEMNEWRSSYSMSPDRRASAYELVMKENLK